MIRRVFSKETYNGYHLVSLRGEGEDQSPVGLFKKSTERDEHGYMITDEDQPKCPHAGEVNAMGRPWGEFIYTPSLCQKCIWIYHTPDNEFDCFLKSRDPKIRARALLRGSD